MAIHNVADLQESWVYVECIHTDWVAKHIGRSSKSGQ